MSAANCDGLSAAPGNRFSWRGISNSLAGLCMITSRFVSQRNQSFNAPSREVCALHPSRFPSVLVYFDNHRWYASRIGRVICVTLVNSRSAAQLRNTRNASRRLASVLGE